MPADEDLTSARRAAAEDNRDWGTYALDWVAKYGILLALILICVGLAIGNEYFLSTRNILNVLRQTSINGILAIGMTFVILTRGIDLSVGSVVAFAGRRVGLAGDHIEHRDGRRRTLSRVARACRRACRGHGVGGGQRGDRVALCGAGLCRHAGDAVGGARADALVCRRATGAGADPRIPLHRDGRSVRLSRCRW